MHKYSGVLFCADCHAPMVKRLRNQMEYYICSTYNHRGNKGCSAHKIYEHDLDQSISRGVLSLFVERAGFWENTERKEDKAEKEKQLKRLDKQLERLYEDSLLEGFPQFLFQKKLEEYTKQKENLLKALSAEESTATIPTDMIVTKELLRLLADRIEVSEKGQISVYKK